MFDGLHSTLLFFRVCGLLSRGTKGINEMGEKGQAREMGQVVVGHGQHMQPSTWKNYYKGNFCVETYFLLKNITKNEAYFILL